MTESYTALKGFNRYNDVDLLNQVQQSVIMFFDWGFLDKGAYTNVAVSQTDIRSNDQSKLRKVSDPNYAEGRVWETFHHNLVWESGLGVGTPIAISGVYVNGSFKTTTTSGFEHYIDYPRGRVIFNAAQTGTIKMAYSYKNIEFGNITTYPEINNIQTDVFSFNNYTSYSSGDYISLLRKQVPIVAVQVTPSLSYSPVSLGTGANWAYTDVLIHVIGTNDTIVNKLVSLISLQEAKTIYMLDINRVISSGAYPIDYRGALNSNPKTYPDLINGGYRDSQLYFIDGQSQAQRLGNSEIYYGTIRFKTETIAAL